MSTKLRYASALSVAAMFVTTLLSTGGSGASAQVYESTDPAVEAAAPVTQQPATGAPLGDDVIVDGPAVTRLPETRVEHAIQLPDVPARRVDSLAGMIEATETPAQLTREHECLAGAIYFEARGEPLPGQLAVGRVIVARARSGRFPASYCGVVYQPSQFSFVRGGVMPQPDRNSRAWAIAVRLAAIADAGVWKSPTEGALYFHAARESAGGRLAMAQVGRHVFYR